MKKHKFLPCPHCGGKNIFINVVPEDETAIVSCSDCDAQVSSYLNEYEKQAVKLWNTRWESNKGEK